MREIRIAHIPSKYRLHNLVLHALFPHPEMYNHELNQKASSEYKVHHNQNGNIPLPQLPMNAAITTTLRAGHSSIMLKLVP